MLNIFLFKNRFKIKPKLAKYQCFNSHIIIKYLYLKEGNQLSDMLFAGLSKPKKISPSRSENDMRSFSSRGSMGERNLSN